MMWETRPEKGMKEKHSETVIVIFLVLLKGGDGAAAFAVSQACTRIQINRNQRHVQFFNVFRATAYALASEALIILTENTEVNLKHYYSFSVALPVYIHDFLSRYCFWEETVDTTYTIQTLL